MYSSIRERLKTFSHFKVLYLSLMVVVSITSITFCIYFFKVFLDDYLTYPTVLKVDIDKGEQLTFPAVTICSHNRINSSKLKRLCSSEKNFNYSICEMVSSILGTYSYNMERFRHMNMSSTANICSNTYYRSEGVLLRVPDQEFLYLSLPEAQRERISFQAEEIIKDCLYEGHHCDARVHSISDRNFSKFWTFRNGNCFTFNSQWKKETRDQLVEGTGALTGLEISLVDSNDGFKDPVRFMKGYKVLVHSPKSVPNMKSDGVLIDPGLKTSIALEKICAQLLRDERCGCGDPRVPLPDHISPCSLSKITDVCCLEEVRKHLSSGRKKCDCPLACLEESFKMTVSMSDFQWQKHAYFARYQSPVVSVVKVYFRIKETVIYSSTPKYQTQDILSAIGSQTGLWLGISIISTFQTIMHLIQRVSNHCNNRNIPVTTTLKPPGRNKSTLDDAGN